MDGLTIGQKWPVGKAEFQGSDGRSGVHPSARCFTSFVTRAECRRAARGAAAQMATEASGLRWNWLVLQCGRVGWTVFLERALLAAEGLFGRNHPLQGAVLVHYTLEEMGVARDERQGRAQKIGGVLRNSFLRLPVLNFVE